MYFENEHDAMSLKDMHDGCLTVTYGVNSHQEHFIISRYGGRQLFISIQFGHAYTRPQLVEKYAKVGATFALNRLPTDVKWR